jgi:hypothetical protein
MTAAQVEAQRANAVHMTNTRVATFTAIRDTASWGITDAMAIMSRLNAPMLRARYRPEIADVQELQKQLETFKLARQVSVQQTEQLPGSHKVVNGPGGPRVETVPGGQRVLSEALFLEVNGTRLTAQEVEQLAAEVKLIAADHNVPLSPR